MKLNSVPLRDVQVNDIVAIEGTGRGEKKLTFHKISSDENGDLWCREYPLVQDVFTRDYARDDRDIWKVDDEDKW